MSESKAAMRLQGKTQGEREAHSSDEDKEEEVVRVCEKKKKRMLTTLCVPVRSPITVLTQPDRV